MRLSVQIRAILAIGVRFARFDRSGHKIGRVLGRLIAGIGVLALAVVAVGLPTALGESQTVGTLQTFPLAIDEHVVLSGIATGADGNVWFADQTCTRRTRCAIGRLSLQTRRVTLFRDGLAPGSIPYELAPGPDGNVWFTVEGHNPAIGRVSPSGRITEFRRGLLRGSAPFDITLGPDGDLWFTDEGRTPAIGRITPNGQISEFTGGMFLGAMPFGIAAGGGDQIWFTDDGCAAGGTCAIGTVSERGQIDESVAGLRAGAEPLGMASGPAGTVWFSDYSGAIGRITAGGSIAEFSRGLRPGSAPYAIAAGPDGAVWFTDEGRRPAVGQVTMAGGIREYSSGRLDYVEPVGITAAADGAMWFTAVTGTGAIWRVATAGHVAVVRAASVAGAGGFRGGSLRCRPAGWARWAGVAPSPSTFAFDGFRWRRNGRLIAGARTDILRATAAGADQKTSCQETVTYPEPWLVSAVSVSRAVVAPPP